MAHLLAAAPALAPPAPTVSWIPGAERITPRPKYLDGSLAADVSRATALPPAAALRGRL